MVEADLDAILGRVECGNDGRWRAISSRFLPGKPIGPFDYKGRRPDDPNDSIDHEDRRELRGLRLFAALRPCFCSGICATIQRLRVRCHNL